MKLSGATWKEWVESALGFIYPNVCQACEKQAASAREGYVCAECWKDIQFIVPPFCRRCGLPYEGDITTEFQCGNCHDVELHFDYARAAVAAKSVVREVIHRFKYHQSLWFEPFLSDLLIRQAAPALAGSEWNLLIPVPLHPVKQRERGFNQAQHLARRLSQATGIPADNRLLQRVEPTRTQTQLSRSERAANVFHAFAIRTGQVLARKNVVLVDDVLTTGATTNACARILRRNGAEKVCVWTVARGL